METVAVKSGLILLYVLLFSSLILTVLGLAGNWVLVAIALIVKLTGLGDLNWIWFAVIVGLAALGEIIESFLGMAVVASRGGTRWGVIGSFVGGILGAVLGSSVIPPIGTIVFAFVGAFAGAALGEYWRNQRVEEALRIGFWSFVGKTMATIAKLACGLGIVWILIVRTW
jgi:uncharacterized protein YqgC (DUF456 family)